MLSVLALRPRSWRETWTPLVTVLVFAVPTLVATLLHLDRFHVHARGPVAVGAAWVWLAVHLVVPVALLVVVLRQARVADSGPTVQRFSPTLSPWLVGLLALHALLSLRERDVVRARSSAVAYVVFGVLQLLALLFYGGSVRLGFERGHRLRRPAGAGLRHRSCGVGGRLPAPHDTSRPQLIITPGLSDQSGVLGGVRAGSRGLRRPDEEFAGSGMSIDSPPTS